MVSTEENSLSDLLGAALPKGVLAGLPGLRGISSPDVPEMAFAAKPAIEAFSYGIATPAMGELAEAALAYTHDEPHALSTQAPATLELVADNGPADEKSTDTLAQEQLEAARAAAVMEIEEMIEQARLNGDDEGKMRLEAILNSVKGAKTISAITAAQSLTGQAGGGKVETPEQKRERLWNEIREKQKTVDEQMREAHARGDISDAQYNEYLNNKAAEDSLSDLPDNDPRRIAAARKTATGATAALDGAAKKADDEGRGADADNARKGANAGRSIIDATGVLNNLNDQDRGASFSRSAPNIATIDSSQAQVQAPSAATLTTIAYNAGAQELTRPLETPAEAAAAASRGTTRNI